MEHWPSLFKQLTTNINRARLTGSENQSHPYYFLYGHLTLSFEGLVVNLSRLCPCSSYNSTTLSDVHTANLALLGAHAIAWTFALHAWKRVNMIIIIMWASVLIHRCITVTTQKGIVALQAAPSLCLCTLYPQVVLFRDNPITRTHAHTQTETHTLPFTHIKITYNLYLSVG